MLRRVLPSALAAIAIGVLAVVLLAPHHGGAIDPVAQAADTTAGAGSAEFGMAGNISAGGQTIPLKGDGAMDMRTQKGRLSMSTRVPRVGDVSIEEIIDGATLYVKLPQAARLPGGKPWMKLDLEAFGKSQGVDVSKAFENGQGNPADMVRYLKAVGNSTKVGTETIRGVPTTHYRAAIDIAKEAAKIGDKRAEESLKQLVGASGVKSIPVDVWIDRAGRVRREAIAMDMPGGSMDLTLEFTRFGVPVTVTPPPADQVLDASSFLEGFAPKSG